MVDNSTYAVPHVGHRSRNQDRGHDVTFAVAASDPSGNRSAEVTHAWTVWAVRSNDYSGDDHSDVLARDAAGAVVAVSLPALDSEPGSPVMSAALPGPGTRLRDVLHVSSPLEVVVHAGFDLCLDDDTAGTPDVEASLERANASAVPTERLRTVEAAYWCRIGEREHLRWVLPYDEEPLLDALARLHARGESGLGEGSRYIGAFRTHGLVVPVWTCRPARRRTTSRSRLRRSVVGCKRRSPRPRR